MKLLLFDIDGTLLRTYGAGVRAMLRAAEETLGERARHANIDLGGALDPWIVDEIARQAGYTLDDVLRGQVRAAYARHIVTELRQSTRAEATPGVLTLLQRLRAERPAQLGMLTGNFAETGAIKLRHVGIEPEWFSPAVWGDAAESRPGLVRVALSHVPGVRVRDVIVIGDTPRDVHCAHENGARCLAVATGNCDEATLRAAGADRVVSDLVDPTPLYEMLAE
jgi:phosphoglycolate phosphatase